MTTSLAGPTFRPPENRFGPRTPFYHDDDDTGGVNPSDPPDPDEYPLPEEVIEAFRKQAEKQDDFEAFAMTLYKDNKEQRDEIRGLKKKTPPGDAVVLTGDEAERYQTLTGDEGDLSDLASMADEYQTLKQKEEKRQREERMSNALDAAGVTNTDAFRKLAPSDADYDVVGEGDDAEGVIKQGDEATPISTFIENEVPEFKPVLTGDNGGDEDGGGSEDDGGDSSTRSRGLPPSAPGGSRSSTSSDESGEAGLNFVKQLAERQTEGDE